MVDLTNCRFGDRFKTRDGRAAIIIKAHKVARRPWFEAIVGEPNCDLENSCAYQAAYYADGTAQEGFTHLDLIERVMN